MINTTTKGRRASAKTRALGEERGYEVYTVPHTRYSKDAFGIVDQIWVSTTPNTLPTHGSDGVVFVQVKSNTWGNIQKVKDFSERHLNDVKIIRWDDREGYRERTFYRGKEGA